MIWVETTPINCLDYFQCTAYELNGEATLREIASGDVLLNQISGLLLSFTVAMYTIVILPYYQCYERNALICCRFINFDVENDNKFILFIGVGISLPHQFFGTVQNNSAVILHNENSEIICHSALRSGCNGQWLSPRELTRSCTKDNTSKSAFNSVKLDLQSVSEEGVYTCNIEDEKQQQQKIFVGVYRAGK